MRRRQWSIQRNGTVPGDSSQAGKLGKDGGKSSCLVLNQVSVFVMIVDELVGATLVVFKWYDSMLVILVVLGMELSMCFM